MGNNVVLPFQLHHFRGERPVIVKSGEAQVVVTDHGVELVNEMVSVRRIVYNPA